MSKAAIPPIGPRPLFKGKSNHGVIYTRGPVVRLALDLAGYTERSDLPKKRILDIGAGYGQFIGEVAERFLRRAVSNGLSTAQTLAAVRDNLRGVEIDPETAQAARQAIQGRVVQYLGDVDYSQVDPTIHEGDFLEWTDDGQRFDFIVGNLPYVKYERIAKLPAGKDPDWLREHFSVFDGRADYSVAFVQHALELLAPGGTIAVITSSRFTQANYGKALRELLASECLVHEVDLSNVQAFDEQVSAYASLFLVRRAKERSTATYIRLHSLDESVLQPLEHRGVSARPRKGFIKIIRGTLPRDGSAWTVQPLTTTRVLKRLRKKFDSVQDVGIEVRKGPATGADGVFAKPLMDFPQSVLADARKFLLPLYHSSQDASQPAVRHLLCPYESGASRLLPLTDLPESVRSYLNRNRDRLETRHVVKEQKRSWWGFIDNADRSILDLQKILVPDLRRGSAASLDSGKWFPGHTVVYLHAPKDLVKGTLVLVQSRLADKYRIASAPAMRNSTPRASTRSLAAMPCPPADVLSTVRSIDDLHAAFGLSEKEIQAVS